jgi:hypothetical protein
MDEKKSELARAYRDAFKARATLALERGPASTLARVADRGARLTAAYSGAPDVGRARAPADDRLAYALAAMECGAFHGLDRVKATATLATAALRARGVACAHALEPGNVGALPRNAPRVRAPENLGARIERAEQAAIDAVTRRSRALDALARLRAAWKNAPSKRERDALRSRYRAACHRMGVKP